MAKKKKIKIEKYQLQIDASRLSLKEDKYISQLSQFLEERISDCKIKKEGHKLNIDVPTTVTSRMLKHKAEKFLYQTGLKLEYRLVSLQNQGIKGYQIMNR
jgi:hypothetical protein